MEENMNIIPEGNEVIAEAVTEEETVQAVEQAAAEILEEPSEEDGQPEEKTDNGPDLVGMTIASGVKPLEMRFAQINSCYRKLPIAYRSFTYINSISMGVIPPEKYAFAADVSEQGMAIAKWNIREGIRTVRRFISEGRHVDFVTVRCPAKLAFEVDLYDWMKGIMEEYDFHTPEKLCLEFPQSLLYENEEKARLSMLNLKLLKVRTVLSGCGADDCPTSRLLRVPVDMVILDPAMTVLAGDRDKSNSLSMLISYLQSMQTEVIAEGVRNDDQIATLSRAGCIGYIPSPAYSGTVNHGPLRMRLDEAVIQKEEDV